MDESIEFLFEIEKKPNLFVGDDGLIALWHFMNGFIMHQRISNMRSQKAEEKAWQFSEYVHTKLNDKRTVSLYRCIVDYTSSDKEAYDLFYHLLHEFYDNDLENNGRNIVNQ